MNNVKTGTDEKVAIQNLEGDACPISDCQGTLRKQDEALSCTDCSEKVTSVYDWRVKCHRSAERDHTLAVGTFSPVAKTTETPVTEKDLVRFRTWARSNGFL